MNALLLRVDATGGPGGASGARIAKLHQRGTRAPACGRAHGPEPRLLKARRKPVRPVRHDCGFPSPGFRCRWPAARVRCRAEALPLSRPPRSPLGGSFPACERSAAPPHCARSPGVSDSAALADRRASQVPLTRGLRRRLRPGVSERGACIGRSLCSHPPMQHMVRCPVCALNLVALADSSCSGKLRWRDAASIAGSVSPTRCAQDINARVHRMCPKQAPHSRGIKTGSVTFMWRTGNDCGSFWKTREKFESAEVSCSIFGGEG
jgi:hypothetical protein